MGGFVMRRTGGSSTTGTCHFSRSQTILSSLCPCRIPHCKSRDAHIDRKEARHPCRSGDDDLPAQQRFPAKCQQAGAGPGSPGHRSGEIPTTKDLINDQRHHFFFNSKVPSSRCCISCRSESILALGRHKDKDCVHHCVHETTTFS